MHLLDMRRRKYLELKKVTGDSGPMSCAMVGSVLHATDSLCLADKWGDWIMDQSRRGHDSIVADMHSKLSAEGEQCHDVYCTEHGGSDVRYSLGPVRVIVLVSSPLPFDDFKLVKILGGRHCWQDSSFPEVGPGSCSTFETECLG
jgi:hypothetical protein